MSQQSQQGKQSQHSQQSKHSPQAVAAMRRNLQQRLVQLEENERDRPVDEDIRFMEWQDNAAKQWMVDNKENGRMVEEESLTLFISSAMRDRTMWPNSGEFRITLIESVDNVIKAELVQASLPLTDPTVHPNNNAFRYSFPPHTSVQTVYVPVGAYQGKELALELQTQLNQDWHAARITGALNTVDFTTGFLVDGTGEPEPTINQFRVTYNRPTHGFVVQIVDAAGAPDPAAVFAIHVRVPTLRGTARTRADDLAEVMGINRDLWLDEGALEPASGTVYITSDTASPNFGPAADVDARFAYSLKSNQAADLRGSLAIVIDIDPLNDNDVLEPDGASSGEVNIAALFGIVYTRDPSFVADRIAEVNTNSFPVRKHYQEGRSRVKDLYVRMRRPDGSIINFGGIDYYLTIRLTVKRVRANRPMFAR